MRGDRRLLWAIGAIGFATLAWLLITIILIGSTLEPEQRAIVMGQLMPRSALLVLAWAAGLFAIGAILRWLFGRYAKAPARLLEQTRVLLASPRAAPMNHRGTLETQALADTIYQLAEQRDRLREDVQAQISLASLSVQQEKNRLAALMAELTQSVVVCNLDGRIILYNSLARLQFKALVNGATLAGGSEIIGIGRSIYAVFDRQLVSHALESIQQRLARGSSNPSAQMVTTTQAGQLLKVQVAPVRSVDGSEGATQLNGFVLMLENVTRAFEEEHVRDLLLHVLTEGSRASLANIQAAVEMLAYPDLEAPMRDRFLGVVREEVGNMGARLNDLTQRAAQSLKARWPLEEMLGTDLLLALCRRIEIRTQRKAEIDKVDADLWLKVDSFSLTQAVEYLAMRLVDEYDIRFFRINLVESGQRARLDLIWVGHAISTEIMMSWEMDSMRFDGQVTPLTVRDVVERHGGEMWFERERTRHEVMFRFLLPLAPQRDQMDAAEVLQNESRPEFYDFDLFQSTGQTQVLEDRLLSELSYTVFDTETTGLRPSEGDQIIQIGATRIVNGKLRKQESFEQLIDPVRTIPAVTIPIHGITQAMVNGKPRIGEVLPTFHRFATDTVLVAHNAAFDMKFLQLQERNTGLVFDHPVLDTLLLSAVIHPNQESHRLEDIAARFGVTVLGRHTALGDALVTAEVWLRLMPLLLEMGITTLRQARDAAQKTYYARLKY